MKPILPMLKDKSFWFADLKRSNPQPFPGKYPTRWWITVRNPQDMVLATVVSKPNIQVMLRIYKIAQKQHGTIALVEFDKGGSFRQLSRMIPRGSFAVQYSAPTVQAFYYPWHTVTDFFQPWHGIMYHKLIVHGSRKFFVYSPVETMLNDKLWEEKLREYRTWLRKSNLLK